jgi:thymidylate synthase
MATELLWFLRGDTNIKYLVDNDCHIWDGDAYKAFEKWKQETDAEIRRQHPTIDFQPLEYESKEEFINKIKTDDEFANKWGELGPIYGKQWRKWNCLDEGFVNLKEGEEIEVDLNCINISHQVDQISNLINDLKTNPDSRRLMVSAWNVGELDQMVLPPCHYGFQVYTRELKIEERIDLYIKKFDAIDGSNFRKYEHTIPTRAISLMWNQRSVDVGLGLSFNIASYGLLLEMIAREVNMIPEHLIGHLGDCHLYSDHIEPIKIQLDRTPRELPRLYMSSGHNLRAALAGKTNEIDLNDFILIGYDPHPAIKLPLSN